MKAMKYALLAYLGLLLSGCAAGNMLMAGYTPPQTIADLLNEQRNKAGGLPAELAMNGQQNKQINSDDSASNSEENLDVTTGSADMHAMSAFHQVESFRPRFSYKSIQDYAAQLSMDLMRNRYGLNADSRVGISSFVKLDTSLQQTTVLGNQLAEYLIAEMQQQGMAVVDHKLMPALEVTSRGDIAFSRDVMRLSKQKMMDHVLSGTLIEKANGVFVNARIISINTNRVVASATVLIPDFVAQSATMGYVLR
jgi:TolB-like protein